MKKFILISTLIGVASIALGQTAITQYNMRLIQQSSFNNASFTPKNKVTIGGVILGSTTIGLTNSGMSRKTLGRFGQGQDQTIKALNSMGDINYFDLDFRKDLIHVGFRVKKRHYFSINTSVRSNTTIYYPRDFATLIFMGNGISPEDPGVGDIPEEYMLLGKRANFNGSGVDHTTFYEFGMQYALKLMEDDRLSIGIRPKIVFGLANINTAVSTLGLTTDEASFGLTLDGSYQLNTSLPGDTTGFNGPGFRNRGFGLDLGASFDITEFLQVSASVNDLGSINWEHNTRNYTATDGVFTFNGFQIDGSIFNASESIDTLSNDFATTMIDSLNNQFGADTTYASYKTRLPRNYNVAVNYTFKEVHTIGALLNVRKPSEKLRAAINLNYTYEASEWINIHANYSIYNRSFLNFGLGASAKLGPLQVYAMSDNILGSYFGYLVPASTRNRHFSLGLNWIIDPVDKNKGKAKDANF